MSNRLSDILLHRLALPGLIVFVVALGLPAAAAPPAAHPPSRHGPATPRAAPPLVPATSHTVAIRNFVFVPATLTVPVGTTVTWTNGDEAPHTVVATARGFRSTALDTDDTYSFTFTTSGDFAYFCSLHPNMTGRIIVTPR
ncbi:cupredoxin family copper-binding protein [uncultured Brevundimonas sp.]|uniref:cupredoxin domain-containing protein n=1 Tax=uncultured Brevundimonas sp. TaxID=213418 RepID=UPI0030EE63C6|tara:strand:+ start:1294 stop:1716 length:423 start_codon:yes stop_codon:yes gene_type:complete